MGRAILGTSSTVISPESNAEVRVVNTTGKSSAQLDAIFPTTPAEGTIIVDNTNHLILKREGTKWFKSAAFTEVA